MQVIVNLESHLIESEKKRSEAQQKIGNLSEAVSLLRARVATTLQDAKEKEEALSLASIKIQKMADELAKNDQVITLWCYSGKAKIRQMKGVEISIKAISDEILDH